MIAFRKGFASPLFSISLFVLAFSILTATPSSSQTWSQDLLAYWSFDEGTGTAAADAKGEANGTLNGNVSWLTGSNAKFGNAVRFDPTDTNNEGYISLPTGGNLANPNATAMSISVWLKSDEDIPTMTEAYRSIFNSDNAQDYFILYYDKGNSQLRAKFTTDITAARPGIPAADVPKGVWYNAIAIYDGVNATVYLNGVQKGQLALTGTIKNGQISAIGRKGTGDVQYWKGDMDDLVIWKRALTPTEINLLATGSSGVSDFLAVDSRTDFCSFFSAIRSLW